MLIKAQDERALVVLEKVSIIKIVEYNGKVPVLCPSGFNKHDCKNEVSVSQGIDGTNSAMYGINCDKCCLGIYPNCEIAVQVLNMIEREYIKGTPSFRMPPFGYLS